jgi:hypothetical protein
LEKTEPVMFRVKVTAIDLDKIKDNILYRRARKNVRIRFNHWNGDRSCIMVKISRGCAARTATFALITDADFVGACGSRYTAYKFIYTAISSIAWAVNRTVTIATACRSTSDKAHGIAAGLKISPIDRQAKEITTDGNSRRRQRRHSEFRR